MKLIVLILVSLVWTANIAFSQGNDAEAAENSGGRLLLEISGLTAPSFETWASASVGIRLRKHEMRFQVLFLELDGPQRWWGIDTLQDRSDNIAFALDHRVPIWKYGRWRMLSHTVLQFQRVGTYYGNALLAIPYELRSYHPRIQLSTGIGMEMTFAKRFYGLVSVRYGVGWGKFYIKRQTVADFRANLAGAIGLGVRI